MTLNPITSISIRTIARQFLHEIGALEPPLRSEICLEARKLGIADESLTDLLASTDIDIPVQLKLDAMLDMQERQIWLRDGLHTNQRRFGTLHEVGHDVIPWHQELFYYCSIFDLPPSTLREIELDANAFAVECMFLGDRFTSEALALPIGLTTAKKLAEGFSASFEAGFRHYVEVHRHPCCLLVSRIIRPASSIWVPGSSDEFEIQYYVNSPSFLGRILPGQRFSCPEITKLFTLETLQDIVEHELPVSLDDAEIVYYAQSFTNSYKVFTLLSREPFT